MWISHKHQIFNFSWEKKSWNICNLAASSLWRQQHGAGSTQGWGLAFLAHPHPTPPRVPAGIRVFRAYSAFSSLSLSSHTGSSWPSPAHFFLHSIPNCPFIIIFPPLESTGFLLKLGVGQRGGVYPERLTSPLASWVAASRALGKLPCLLKCSQPAQLLPDAQKEQSSHQPLSQVENRSALSSLCALEGIILLFWAAGVPSIQWGGLWEWS